MTGTAVPSALDRAADARRAMTDRLCAGGRIISAAVEAAFRAVPREAFTPPGTPLEDACGAGEAVTTKRAADGRTIPAVSAPWQQAKMITQAVLEPGMRVPAPSS